MGVLWPLEPATAAKHRLYKRYFDAWWPVLLQPARSGFRRPKVTLLDAFAGPGRYEGGEEGSPVFTLDRLLHHTARDRMRLSRDRVQLIFVEKDRARYKHLLGELESRFGSLESLPVRVEVRHGEAGRDSGALLTELNAWGHPILAIFDSWGNVNVPLTLMRQIAQNPSSEVITTFGPNWFSRRDQLDSDVLDAVFGGREHWTPAEAEQRPDERWRVWLHTYRESLHRAGFPYRLQFEVVPKTGQPLYLVFGTGHEKGVDAMKDAMWDVDGDDGMAFRDPRTRKAVAEGQQPLWGPVGEIDPELRELVMQRLAQGETTLEQLGRWLLRETARWRVRDARKSVQSLKDEGLVAIAGSGRLTAQTVVRPRRRRS
ncbi:three-Cys-motif partner protein TcmP [Yinghuangia sp. ASG 101]|uniref:three-Cys-motif partner protein TcmP n=1 Tax=Yinghuangia sp. ASG 101 TaxID=2896848 RepID=UPI001E61E7AF|nr:three-Cys-motif partner protein TcmP [Yinghuangia sp. ASG 101]UGQ15605.1 three-Cys-motif partner protein TcmP [Yinghuangia sp. ASG 101]